MAVPLQRMSSEPGCEGSTWCSGPAAQCPKALIGRRCRRRNSWRWFCPGTERWDVDRCVGVRDFAHEHSADEVVVGWDLASLVVDFGEKGDAGDKQLGAEVVWEVFDGV